MSIDRPLLGVSLMLGFCALAPLSDAMAKLIGTAVPLGQVMLVRFAVQTILLWPLVARGGHVIRLTPGLTWLLVARMLLQLAGMWAMFLSLRYLPLADAIAIAYVMPFLMLLLGWLVLDEDVGARRFAACIVGFCGTLMVMQPSFSNVGWVAALPLLVAVIFTLYMLVTRRVCREMDPIPLQAVNGLMGTALLFPIILLAEGTGWAELDPVDPGAREIGLLAAVGILGTMSHMFMTWSLRFAPASTLAPMQYLEIPFAALFGWLIFAQFPDGLARVGILVVMASGLYIIWRERQLLRLQARPLPPPMPPAAE